MEQGQAIMWSFQTLVLTRAERCGCQCVLHLPYLSAACDCTSPNEAGSRVPAAVLPPSLTRATTTRQPLTAVTMQSGEAFVAHISPHTAATVSFTGYWC